MRAALLTSVLLGGCLNDLVPLRNSSTEQTQSGGDAAVRPDAGGGGGAAPDLALSTPPDLAPKTCIDRTTTLDTGHHNPGLDCMVCHSAANPAIPQFTVAGTLYDSAAGTNPVIGATVEVTDAAGVKTPLVTAMNGNFYTTQAVALPLHARASGCPDNQVMPTTAGSGSCNSCHGTANRVHLP
jgi:hypothetical protein